MTRLVRTALLALSIPAIAQEDVAQQLAARALGNTPMMDDLRELCDRIGGRPTGSPACERAIDWAVKKFREAGIESVTAESFSVPVRWLPVSAEAGAIAPEKFSLRIAAAPMSPSTQGTIEARLVDVGDATPEDFARLEGAAKGAIVLVHSREMRSFDDLFAEYMRNAGLIDAMRRYRPAAMLLESTRPRGLLYRHPISLEESYAPVPTAVVAREQAERLARLAEHENVRMRLSLQNRTGGAYESRNVVAEIRGREKPDEIVLIGAHLDSWDLGTGAEDNGVNAAMILDIARAFHQLGLRPRRTVRFVLFTGEEQGMYGSVGYVARHRAELDGHVMVTVFDTGSGRLSGFYLNGREELRKPLNDVLAPVGSFGATEHVADAIDGTDNFDFLISGVPNLVGIQDPIPYLPDYHAESDTVDRVNVREQGITEAIASALVWGFAESPQRPAPRQNREQVMKLVIDTKLDQQMKPFGQWEDFQAGKRGLFH